MQRIYSLVIEEHLAQYRQMIFLAGPRQVGKTTCAKRLAQTQANFHYINWETAKHKKRILKGAEEVAHYIGLEKASAEKPVIVFDELHKYRRWKSFLKGFFDLYEDRCRIIVTGSAKLDMYRRGGDSLMGRYFPYRIHPLSIGELLHQEVREEGFAQPKKIDDAMLNTLLDFGGFPEPYLNANKRFFTNWQRLRRQQLIREDIRELNQIQDFSELETLFDLLKEEASNLLNVASLANQLNLTETKLHRWLKILESFYYSFSIKPWSKNVRRATRKMRKLYLWDWSMITDHGRRIENFVAAHLLKSVHFWTDIGLGEYELYYVRDKNKREVDFLVTKNRQPWFLVEVKASANGGITKSLHHFYNELDVEHAFQVAYDMPYEQIDCFTFDKPIIVPLTTFLSQLI